MRLRLALAWLLAIVAAPVIAQAPSALAPPPPLAPKAPALRAGQQAPVPAAALTKADVDAWLDGFLPYALETGDVAGAAIAVVKDGQVLTERGYGYADVAARTPVSPTTTLFRPGSISKLFTWTAVMQQVQAGRLDLDRDINAYLDFRIPPFEGKPVTLRNLMTHTAGFEETAKFLLYDDPAKSKPLDRVLKRWVPARIYAPGTVPAYSNYGASLAGYIVQRVSGEPFAAYVAHHIFRPLGMAHSSFAQPLPPALAGALAKGYVRASEPPKPFEIIDMSPAGALSSTADDMARFMLAHLRGGAPLLDAHTAALMHAPANTPIPGLPPMALGFYHEGADGLRIIGHGGDTDVFHSDLHLYLDRGVGLFMSFNSAGKDGAVHVLRQRLFDDFTARYFPMAMPTLPTLGSAHADGLKMVGRYVSSRGARGTFLTLVALLGEAKVALGGDDTLTVSSLLTPAGVPKRWREVAPFQWQEVGGTDRLGARVVDGRVAMFAPAGTAPIIEYLPAPAALDAGWILPLAVAALIVVLVAALAWPIGAVARWRYGVPAPALDRRARRLRAATRVTAWIVLAVAIGWMALLSSLSDVTTLDGRLDGWMRLLQLLLLLAVAGALLAVWHAIEVARRPGRHRFATGCSLLVAAALLFLAWLGLHLNLLTLSLDY